MGKTAEHYRKNEASRKKKAEYDKEFNKKPEQRKKRSELTKIRREAKKKGRKIAGKDASHTSRGIVFKSPSANRGSKSDSPGDRRARGRKRRTQTKKKKD